MTLGDALSPRIPPSETLKQDNMKILLKDPAKVDAVIRKIRGKFSTDETFVMFCVPYIKGKLEEGETVILNMDYAYDPHSQQVKVGLTYEIISEIPTDEEFINDKEW